MLSKTQKRKHSDRELDEDSKKNHKLIESEENFNKKKSTTKMKNFSFKKDNYRLIKIDDNFSIKLTRVDNLIAQINYS